MKKIQLDLKVEAALDALAEELKAIPRGKAGNTGHVPGALRERIVRTYREAGLSAEDLAGRLRLSGTSIRGWVKKEDAKRRKETARKRSWRRAKRASFSEVKVRTEAKLAVARAGLTLELRGGAKVHGLSLSEIRELVATDGGAG